MSISFSQPGSSFLEAIAHDFVNATDLALVMVDIRGLPISPFYNCTPFCQQMRASQHYRQQCQRCDKRGGFAALEADKPHLYRCHAGLVEFSLPLEIDGQLLGFVICGQVRVDAHNDIASVLQDDDAQHAQAALMSLWHDVPQVDYTRLTSAARLLNSIVTSYLNNNVRTLLLNKNLAEPRKLISHREKRHDVIMNKTLRYIDEHLFEGLTLEKVAAHVYLSPYYFSRLFRKHQGVGFNAWVNEKKMQRARDLLHSSDWSIDCIARRLHFSQTSYFCKLFRQTYQLSPQQFRLQRTA
nr:PocR ligand-binding domain-containing protein [uncultured Enterobacter sp.]